MFGIMQLSCMIVVQDVSEDFRVTIKKVLASLFVEEEFAFGWAEERVRVLLERVPPRLEPPSRYVDEHLLILGLASVLQDGRRGQGARCNGNPTDGSGPRKRQPGWRGKIFTFRESFEQLPTHPLPQKPCVEEYFFLWWKVKSKLSATASLRVVLLSTLALQISNERK